MIYQANPGFTGFSQAASERNPNAHTFPDSVLHNVIIVPLAKASQIVKPTLSVKGNYSIRGWSGREHMTSRINQMPSLGVIYGPEGLGSREACCLLGDVNL